MLVIIAGLYAFLWAKNKEFKNMNQTISVTAASTELPVTNGSSNNNETNNAGCDQAAKLRCPSTVAPTSSPDEHADVTIADTVKITV